MRMVRYEWKWHLSEKHIKPIERVDCCENNEGVTGEDTLCYISREG